MFAYQQPYHIQLAPVTRIFTPLVVEDVTGENWEDIGHAHRTYRFQFDWELFDSASVLAEVGVNSLRVIPNVCPECFRISLVVHQCGVFQRPFRGGGGVGDGDV